MRILLITGAAGSIGSELVKTCLNQNYDKIIGIDNNEYGIASLLNEASCKRLIMPVADVRDKDRMFELLKDVDSVIHCAALKRVEMAEYNVVEAIKTNVFGTINLVECCRERGVKKLLLISSDKAVTVGEMALYGATKMMQEKIVLAEDSESFKCSVVRFGNVVGTRGDVNEIWKKQISENQPITITDVKMRRYFWEMSDAVKFISMCLGLMEGGEIFVPDIKEYNVLDFAKKMFGDDVKYKETGLRKGEVFLHELMSENERIRAERFDWGWIIR